MTHKDNSGPAFPVTFEGGQNNGVQSSYFEGMTLRDWFAGQALVGHIAAHAHPESGGLPIDGEAADRAYQLADAMLEARSK